MKPSKKQNSDSSKDRKFTGEQSTSKIKNYFKTTPKPFAIEDDPKKNHVDDSKAYYVACLKEKLKLLQSRIFSQFIRCQFSLFLL